MFDGVPGTGTEALKRATFTYMNIFNHSNIAFEKYLSSEESESGIAESVPLSGPSPSSPDPTASEETV